MAPRIDAAVRSSTAISRVLSNASSVPSSAAILQSSRHLKSRQYATSSTASLLEAKGLQIPEGYVPPTQPPSARRPEFRKTQLLRSYTSMLRSTPLMLLFQHNNISGSEWSAVRRELRLALAAVPAPTAGPDGEVPLDITSKIEFQVLKTRLFDTAFKIVEFFDADAQKDKSNAYMHDLSQTAYDTIKAAPVTDPNTAYGSISPLLVGQLAALTFPAVSPAHLAAALKILAPSPQFTAPGRKKNPGYYEPLAQNGLQKLILLGGRIEGKVFDGAGVNWVGGIDGGIHSLRAQLVHMLQNAGMGLTSALEGQSKGLWLTMESRRTQMEEEANGGSKPASEDTTA